MGVILHFVADVMGHVRVGHTVPCAFCAQSPFGCHGSLKKLGPMFNGWEQLPFPEADSVCRACKSIMGGRPGSNPPPLRTFSLRIPVATRELKRVAREDWWPLLATEPGEPALISWAITRKRHHVQHAGISEGRWWHIGSDDGPLCWEHDPDLLTSAKILHRAGSSKGSLLTGRYPAHFMARHASLIQEHAPVLAAYRGPILDLIVHALTRPESAQESTPQEATMALPQSDRMAVEILSCMAWGSEFRVGRGRQFWGGYYLARINRFARLPLPDFVSRILADIDASPISSAEVGAMVEAMPDAVMADVSEALRKRSALLHGLSFGNMEKMRVGRKGGVQHENNAG